PPAPRLVYLSSIGASEHARSTYLRARGKAEAVVTGSGLPWVIARPSIITGDRDDRRLGERTAGLVGDGLLAVAGLLGARRTRDRYRTTTPDVLASALIRLAEAPEHDRIVDGADLR
ncbi:MAG TPA: epimerase, partial [Kofleriaceae bacterium]|nr:epimerase [Kofleriaceae bacterium]